MTVFEYRQPENFPQSTESFWGVNKEPKELNKDMNFQPIPGYQGWNKSVVSENIYGMPYAQSRRKADEILNKINKEKAETLLKSSRLNS